MDRTLKYHEQLKSPEGAPLLAYLTEERKFSQATVDRFLLGAVVSPDVLDEDARGMLAIPYNTPAGPVALRFRRPPHKDTGPKYWQLPHTDLTIYNTPAFFESEDTIAITEGEMDCITLNQAGIPAVGLPGASSWKNHYELLFEGYASVVICADNDDQGAGRKFAAKVAQKVPGPRVVLMPEGHDVNSYYAEFGRTALREYMGVETL
ncbi:MAG TPA: toprim domain-containing protein [Arthrobacter sp.]|nr:toprim domain-containing protein [Arthrobacter sp.]